jgi:putative endopeptidase
MKNEVRRITDPTSHVLNVAMRKLSVVIAVSIFIAGCAGNPSAPSHKEAPETANAASGMRISGIDLQYFNHAVRAQDDFYRHINGKWLQITQIPPDHASWGTIAALREKTQPQLRGLIETAMHEADKYPGTDTQKIGDLYASFMDEQRIESLGLQPLAGEFAAIAAIKNKKQIPALIAHFHRIGATAPYDIDIGQDARDSTKYVVSLSQSGLGLPDRDYYIKEDDAKLKAVRNQYRAYMERMLRLAGDHNASANASSIMALETALAKVQWTKVENRDPIKTYNKVPLNKLDGLTAGYSWNAYLSAAGIDHKINYVIINQPSYFSGWGRILQTTPLPVWKAYFQWHLLRNYARFLPKAYVGESFAFNGTVLRGIPENQPRWKRGVALVEASIGEGLGKLYVAKYFPPETKGHMERLVGNLLVAYRQSIETLDWMGPETKKEAQAKLAKIHTKIGYPDKWRDYSKLVIHKGDLIGNVMRANAFEYQRNINKLGKPIDRTEWFITPQTVNAYYSREMNEIVFPAAILQPPFFNPKADDAVNYGGIGAVIGHEISHGFDDKGSQFDGDGNLRDWWTKEDHERFAAKTQALVTQYSVYSPQPGYYVNGELTLGENIADNAGLAIAYKAYQISLGGQPAPVMEGLTGEQRFFIGWAQVWRAKVRPEQELVYLKIDPHAPDQFRGNGAVKNQPGFYRAFNVKEGDRMYLPPAQRVIIW